MKNIFRFYPDKSKRPHLKGLLIGSAYDFGWIFLAALVGILYTLSNSNVPEIFSQNLRFGIVVLVGGAIQIFILEAVLWWLFYLIQKKSKT